MMSRVDLVASDFETLELMVGKIQMTKRDRVVLEMALSNLRDSLRDMGVEVDD
jgi:hypothetical protein